MACTSGFVASQATAPLSLQQVGHDAQGRVPLPPGHMGSIGVPVKQIFISGMCPEQCPGPDLGSVGLRHKLLAWWSCYFRGVGTSKGMITMHGLHGICKHDQENRNSVWGTW